MRARLMCAFCGGTFLAPMKPGRGRPRKTCSDECSKALSDMQGACSMSAIKKVQRRFDRPGVRDRHCRKIVRQFWTLSGFTRRQVRRRIDKGIV